MRYEEEQLTAAVEQVKTLSAEITNSAVLSDLTTIIAGFQIMRPYVSVGLKVCPSAETLEAIERLHQSGVLTQEQWIALNRVVALARKGGQASPVRQRKPCRRVASRLLGRRVTLTDRLKRVA